MILGALTATGDNRTTLDDLFRRAAVRRPESMALSDPPNRNIFTDGEPRTLTYAQADRAVWAIAARLRQLGLQTDAVVALQLPNTVESVLAILGVLRAGMIAAPLPMLWRKAEIVSALAGTGVKMLITCARISEARHAEFVTYAAAELFSIRHVGSFGAATADGVVPMDDVFTDTTPGVYSAIPRGGNPAAHVAVVTWDSTAGGPVVVARNHQQLIAGGLAVFLEGGLESEAAILSAAPTTSFAGLGGAMLPWLLSGGLLTLHHPFNAEVFISQRDSLTRGAIVVPGVLADRLSQGHASNLDSVIALWAAPERSPAEQPLDRSMGPRIVDITAFGEVGLVASRAAENGMMAPIPNGVIGAPSGSATAVPVIETSRTASGTLALRGTMVASNAFPHGAAQAETGSDGFVDTFYPCRFGAERRTLIVTGPQPGMAGIGGYRFAQARLDALVAGLSDRAVIVALPDALTGQRLAGSAPDAAATQANLIAGGHNPLIAHAFRPRSTPPAT